MVLNTHFKLFRSYTFIMYILCFKNINAVTVRNGASEVFILSSFIRFLYWHV